MPSYPSKIVHAQAYRTVCDLLPFCINTHTVPQLVSCLSVLHIIIHIGRSNSMINACALMPASAHDGQVLDLLVEKWLGKCCCCCVVVVVLAIYVIIALHTSACLIQTKFLVTPLYSWY